MREAKAFMAFEIAPYKACYKGCSREHSSTVAPQQSLSQCNASASRTYNPGFDTICWTKPLTISYEN